MNIEKGDYHESIQKTWDPKMKSKNKTLPLGTWYQSVSNVPGHPASVKSFLSIEILWAMKNLMIDNKEVVKKYQ